MRQNRKNIWPNLSKRLAEEVVEPAWGWGFRIAIAVLLPLLLSLRTDHPEMYIWAVIGAETVSLIELKGSAALRARLLLAACLFSVLFTVIGSLTGHYLWLNLLFMLMLAFACGLMKSLGDWGLGLAISIYLYYLLAQAHPLPWGPQLGERALNVALGGLWGLVVGVFSYSFLPQGKPFRRTIAHIWKNVDALMQLVVSDWDRQGKRMRLRDLYLKEQSIRQAINESLELYEQLYDAQKKEPATQKALAFARRCASMASLQAIALAELSHGFQNKEYSLAFRLQVHSILRILQQISERMSYYFFTKKEEEWLLVKSRLARLHEFKTSLEKSEAIDNLQFQQMMRAITRFANFAEKSLDVLAQQKEQRIYNSYSFAQTLNILHPKYLKNNLSQLFNADSLIFKYALRLGITATLGLLVAHYFFPKNGYWLPFTIMIVTQPFFGATFKKGLERSLGTLFGILVGSGLLVLPLGKGFQILMVVVGAVMMVYYLRKNYAWAAFFITIFLVGLLSSEQHFSVETMMVRMLCTTIGASMAILSTYLFFPIWDKELFPRYFKKAMIANYEYFQYLFMWDAPVRYTWTHFKKAAETANSNAFDSLNRYRSEPTIDAKQDGDVLYTFMTHTIRITRELNNLAVEKENMAIGKSKMKAQKESRADTLLTEINASFKKTLQLIQAEESIEREDNGISFKPLTEHQSMLLEKLWIELNALQNGLVNKPSLLKH